MTQSTTHKQQHNKVEQSVVKYGLHRRERIRHQVSSCMVKLSASQKHLLQASNDAIYDKTNNKEVFNATA